LIRLRLIYSFLKPKKMYNPFEELGRAMSRIEAAVQNQTVATPEIILSKTETAELLGITMNTLSKYTKDGTIPAYGIGSRVMYKKSEVLNSLTRIN
jgi:excisionase family DNA binding protein